MSKYPNGDKVTTKNSESCKANETNLLLDEGILGERVILHLEVRKFFCHNDDCRRNTFAEQPGDEVFRYRRR